MIKNKEANCIICGEPFIKNAPSQKYCCSDCRNEATKKKYELKKVKRYCIVCGKELTKNKSKYCSKECSGYSHYKECTENETDNKPKVESIDAINAKARAEGLSYGQYVAKYGYK